MRASVAQVAWRGVIWSSGKQRPPSGRSERYPQAPVGLLRALIERDQHALVGVSFKRDQPVIARAPEHASAGKRLEQPTAVGSRSGEAPKRRPSTSAATAAGTASPDGSRVSTEYASSMTCAGSAVTPSSARAAASCSSCHADNAAMTALVSAVSAGPAR